MINLGRFIVSPRRIFSCRKKTDRFPDSINVDTSSPAFFAPAHASKSGDCFPMSLRVSHILCMSAFAQVLAAIIQSVAVFVVALFSGNAAKDETVHGEMLFSTPLFPLSVEGSSIAVPIGIPVPLRQPFKVSGIDERILPLCKWNQLVGWVKRLDYVVSLHAAFHRCTSYALRFSLYLIIGGLLTVPAFSQVQPMPIIPNTFLDVNGKPLSGGCLATFISGTATPLQTYSDAAGTVPNSDPVQLTSAGTAIIFLQGQAYTLKLYAHGVTNNCATSLGPLQYSIDGINPGANSILAANNVWSGSNIFNGSLTTNSTTTFNAGYTSNGPSIMTAGGSMAGTFSGNPTFSGSPHYSDFVFFDNGFQVNMNATFNGEIISTVATGNAPFLVSSTTVNPNLNANFLEGTDWASPDPIGSVAPNTGKFTSLQFSTGPVATAYQGTDTHVLSAGTFTGGTGSSLCKDANGGATTTGCVTSGITQIQTTSLGTTTCTTGNSTYDTCNVTLSWPVNFSDTSYQVVCQGFSANDPRAQILDTFSKAVGTVTIRIVTEGSVAINFADLECHGIHN